MTINVIDGHIEKTEGVVSGQPCIAGRRITVKDIVIWHEWMGKSVDEIALEYDLTLSEVYSALAYYYDHQSEIDKTIAESNAFIESLKEKIPSKIALTRKWPTK